MTDLAERYFEAVVEDMTIPTDVPTEAAYMRASAASAALRWTLAEVLPHQAEAVGNYLSGLLAREPLRSGKMWEPHRVILGLFVLTLRDLAEPEAVSLPAWYAKAIESLDAP